MSIGNGKERIGRVLFLSGVAGGSEGAAARPGRAAPAPSRRSHVRATENLVSVRWQ